MVCFSMIIISVRNLRVKIRICSLTKKFGKLTAVDHISFQVMEGEIFGLLGSNGAGKTTTIRMLCTLLKPDGGTAYVAGHNIRKDQASVRSKIGIVSEGIEPYVDLTLRENLEFFGKVYKIPKKERANRIAHLLNFVGLNERADSLLNTYSEGMRKRASIALALIHNPEVLFFDEITAGLDPLTTLAIRNFTKDLCEQGRTVIWASHNIEESEKLCNRVAIIHCGKIVAIGKPSEIKRRLAVSTLEKAFIELVSRGR
jgi:ABC-2 type transport system ATP-binding protein